MPDIHDGCRARIMRPNEGNNLFICVKKKIILPLLTNEKAPLKDGTLSGAFLCEF